MSDLINISKELNNFQRKVVEGAQRELGATRTIRGRKVRRVSSDKLRTSLYGRVFVRKNVYSIGFGASGEAQEYAAYIHEGVNGRKVKYRSPFSFRKKFVNIGAMEKYIRQKPVRLRNKDGAFIKMTDKNIKSAAFAMSRTVAEKGIAPVPYFRLSLERELKKNESKIVDALASDAFDILGL
jgi:hypothetical protein